MTQVPTLDAPPNADQPHGQATCVQCGAVNAADQHFCGSCGATLVATAEVADWAAPPAPPPTVLTVAGKPARHRWRWLAVGTALAAAAGVAVFSVNGNHSDKQTITGVYTLTNFDGSLSGTWDSCEGADGYSDFGPGQFVTITNEKGDKVGGGATRSLSSATRPHSSATIV